MRSQRYSFRPAFTLIELVLVMLVITIAVGVAVPSLRGWSRGSRMRDSVDSILALGRLARMQAISSGQIHRLSLDSNTGRCIVSAQDGEQFVELGEGAGGTFTVPDGVQVQLADLQGQPKDFIEFYPNGRMQTARIRVSMDDDYQTVIESATSTEGFRVPVEGGSR